MLSSSVVVTVSHRRRAPFYRCVLFLTLPSPRGSWHRSSGDPVRALPTPQRRYLLVVLRIVSVKDEASTTEASLSVPTSGSGVDSS